MKNALYCVGLIILWLSTAAFPSPFSIKETLHPGMFGDNLCYNLDMDGDEWTIVSAIGGNSKYKNLEKYLGETDSPEKIIEQMNSSIMIQEDTDSGLKKIFFKWLDSGNQVKLGVIKQLAEALWQIDFHARPWENENLTEEEQKTIFKSRGILANSITKKVIEYYSQNEDKENVGETTISSDEKTKLDISEIVFRLIVKDIISAYKKGWEPGFSEQIECFKKIMQGEEATLQFGARDGTLITKTIKPFKS
jgi:hypothetical protein